MVPLPFPHPLRLLPLLTVGEDGRGHMARLDTDIILALVWMNLAAWSALLCLSLWCVNMEDVPDFVGDWLEEVRRCADPPPPQSP